MSTYEEMAYTEAQVTDAIRAAGLKGSPREVIAHFNTEGLTLTKIAERLQLNRQRFWAYYQQWCRANVEPLRLD
jgi:hypothetical protein